ncbi:hypothetical protein [Solirubrum puertoriconensis]|uniref:Uncharacterized protein n=1 Tax=Solirubrum puertoriconensis TaxID=1751427 RepID=A0A9X0HPN6_SOLP1|nr:hypothetical protein [Solirubrum puertoriconensis]KUG09826.1 hypothetical protein ASU33_19340 [Solirubrum puertoriconensis]
MQQLHGRLLGLNEFTSEHRAEMLRLTNEALPELERLASVDITVPWQRQVRASRELVEMAAAEAAKPLPQWRLVLTALSGALYPWAHLPALPRTSPNANAG